MKKQVFVMENREFLSYQELSNLSLTDSVFLPFDTFFNLYPLILRANSKEKEERKSILEQVLKNYNLNKVTPNDEIKMNVQDAIFYFSPVSHLLQGKKIFQEVQKRYNKNCVIFEFTDK